MGRFIKGGGLLLFAIAAVVAQSGFEDSEGKSSFIVQQGGMSKINITDESIKIGYLHRPAKHVRLGVELSGKAANGIGTLFENGEIAPEVTSKLSLGYQWLFCTAPGADEENSFLVDDWATLQVGYARAQYKLFDASRAFNDQKVKEHFNGYSVTLYYNALFRYNVAIGLSFGIDHRNNYQELKEVELLDRTVVFDSAGVSRSVTGTAKMRSGTLREVNHYPGNFDIVWMPGFLGNRIGLDLFGRLDISNSEATFRPGIGVFIAEKGAPTRVIGGVSYEGLAGKRRVGFVAGFNF